MKFIFYILSLFIASYSISQGTLKEPDSMSVYNSPPVTVYSPGFMNKYNTAKRLVVKVYPYALYAADIIDQIENNSESIQKRRKKNKFYKDSYEELKEDFKYVLLDLYTQEGIMLMKLVHRETGMTVYEIAEKYRGKKNAGIFLLMGKIWDQDIKIEFDPKGTDNIVEQVILDIQSGLIEFDDTIEMTSKSDYKEEKKRVKERKKVNKKKQKKNC